MEELAKTPGLREFPLKLGSAAILILNVGKTLYGSGTSPAESGPSALSFSFDPIALPSNVVPLESTAPAPDSVPVDSVAPPSDLVTLDPVSPPANPIMPSSIARRSDSAPLSSIPRASISAPLDPFSISSGAALFTRIKDDVEEATWQRKKFQAIRIVLRHVLDLGIAGSEVCKSIVQPSNIDRLFV